jgi:hypothetical protein
MSQPIYPQPTSLHRPQRSPRFSWRTVLKSMVAGAIVIGLTVGPWPVQAAPAFTTWYVAPFASGGKDSADCLTQTTPCEHIQNALGKASPGDTVSIAPGVYSENLSINANVTLDGAEPATTIIDGQAVGRTVDVDNAVVNLIDLTIRNGQYGYGAGLNIGAFATVNLSNCRIVQNAGSGGGAGIANQGKLKLTNVTLSDNVNNGNDNGGGLRNLGSAEFVNSVVDNNESASNAGGIYNRGVLTLTNSTLSNNHAAAGGAIYNQSALALSNVLISQNQANTSAGGGIYNSGLGFNPGIVIDAGSLITGNVAATSGGGIHNASTGQLTLNGTRVVSNTASTFGGGLYSDGAAALTGVTVLDNRAISGSGGGLYSFSANSTLTIIQGQINNNRSAANGGGLLNSGNAVLSYVGLNNNQASSGSGGGVYNAATGRLTLAQSQLSGNSATIGNGGGLFNEATSSLTQIVVNNNQSASGGGLYNDSTGHLLVSVSSVDHNNSLQSTGGGVSNRGTLTLTQSTLYSNTTTLQGGSGLYNNATAELTNVTLSNNSVLSATTGAILNDGGTLNILNGTISHNRWPALVRTGGSIVLANTIVANSSGGVNCSNPLTSNGYNLDSGTSCALNATGDISNTDPLLGPLVNNGGATLTRLLQVDSHAIDAGNNAACPPLDQRGIARPQGDRCDIGAYETIGYTNNVSGTVAGGGCFTSTTVVSNSYPIGSLHVGVNATLAPRSDFRVKLYAPDHRSIQVLGAPGTSGANLDVLWDDDSPFGPVGNGDQDIDVPYYENVRVPDQSLVPLFGRSLRGAWQLELCNLSEVGTNSATLNRWSLLVPSVTSPKVFLPLVRRR